MLKEKYHHQSFLYPRQQSIQSLMIRCVFFLCYLLDDNNTYFLMLLALL